MAVMACFGIREADEEEDSEEMSVDTCHLSAGCGSVCSPADAVPEDCAARMGCADSFGILRRRSLSVGPESDRYKAMVATKTQQVEQ